MSNTKDFAVAVQPHNPTLGAIGHPFLMTSQQPRRARIDMPVAVRGASAGFSVLLIGGLIAVLLGLKFPAAGPLLGLVAAVIGFHVAARRVGTASIPALHGAFAAVLAYLLVLPIAWTFSPGHSSADVGRALLNLALALSTGSLTGWMNSHKRG